MSSELPLETEYEIDAGNRSFASGLLLDLIAALRQTRRGALIGIRASKHAGPDLESWSRLTGHAIVGARSDAGSDETARWVIRHGAVARDTGDERRPLGSRLWLYTNFDCNLRCDYCCVRSSPRAARRTLDLSLIRRIAADVPGLGVDQIFLTGGEPFLRADIAEVANVCAAAAETTVLTNGMLFSGPRLHALRAIDRAVALQISLDSPTPEAHDSHRGQGSWRRAVDGIRVAREEGFRVRVASTVAGDAAAEQMTRFFDDQQIPADDRVIRPIVRRGFATEGTALSRMDLVPEVTITSEGVYWHPVGAEDGDMLVRREIEPLADVIAAVRAAAAREREHATRLAEIFHCA